MNLAEHLATNPDTSFSKYIGNISGAMGFNPTKIPLDKFEAVLKDEADPSKINPILFEVLNEVNKPTPLETKDVMEDSPDDLLTKANLGDLRINTNIKRRLEDAESNLNARLNDMRSRYQMYLTKASQVSDARDNVARLQKLLELGDESPTLAEQIKDIESKGWWKFIRRSGNHLYFLTSRLCLKEVNPAANLNIQVDMGQFIVRVNFREKNAQAYPAFNVLYNTGSTHPHVSGGDFCWGDGADRFFDALNAGDLQGAMNMVQALLTTYEPSNPYRTLAECNRKAQEGNRHNNCVDQSRTIDHNLREAMVEAIPYAQYHGIKYVDIRDKYAIGTFIKYRVNSTSHRVYMVASNGIRGCRLWRLYEYDDTLEKMVICKLSTKSCSREYFILDRESVYSIMEPSDVKIADYISRTNKNYEDVWNINPDLFLKEVYVNGMGDRKSVLNGKKVTYVNNRMFFVDRMLFNDIRFKPQLTIEEKEIDSNKYETECSDCSHEFDYEYDWIDDTYNRGFRSECPNCGYYNWGE